jgi:catechol 2,3-dioxygenase-like lactoylglutathione lyase family enzyme
MINHITVHVNDIEASKTFYLEALKPLGYEMVSDHPEWKLTGIGKGGKSDTWLYGAEGAKQVAHMAYSAESKQEVEDFHAAAITHGGTDNGAPGYRKNYTPGYYAAFAFDPSGNNIEVVYLDPNPSE